MKRNSYSGIVFFIVIPILIACSSPSPETKPPFAEQTTTVFTETPLPSATATPIPLTATLTPDPTWTPFATLSEQEALDLVHDLILDNPDCRLPCWGGISLGITSWEEVRQIYATFATNDVQQPAITRSRVKDGRIVAETIYHALFRFDEEGNMGGISFGVAEGDIITLVLGFNSKYSIQLQEFLVTYGQPKQIYLKTFDDVAHLPLPFYLALFYEDQHILAVYNYDNAVLNNGIVRLCKFFSVKMSRSRSFQGE